MPSAFSLVVILLPVLLAVCEASGPEQPRIQLGESGPACTGTNTCCPRWGTALDRPSSFVLFSGLQQGDCVQVWTSRSRTRHCRGRPSHQESARTRTSIRFSPPSGHLRRRGLSEFGGRKPEGASQPEGAPVPSTLLRTQSAPASFDTDRIGSAGERHAEQRRELYYSAMIVRPDTRRPIEDGGPDSAANSAVKSGKRYRPMEGAAPPSKEAMYKDPRRERGDARTVMKRPPRRRGG